MKPEVYEEYVKHPDIAITLDDLGHVLKSQGKLTEAASMFRQSLAMKREVYWEDAKHPSIAISLGNLAQVLEAVEGLRK